MENLIAVMRWITFRDLVHLIKLVSQNIVSNEHKQLVFIFQYQYW